MRTYGLLIETGEEIGSPGLREVCRQYKHRLAADVLIASDGPRLAPERPTILENFLASLGCTVVDFPHKTECCGSFVAVSSPEVARDCSTRILETAVKQGAEMLVVSCPLCQYNLDRAQREAATGRARAAKVPVLYFSQLLALALGCDEACLHLDDHRVDPRPRLSKWLEPRRQMATLAQ